MINKNTDINKIYLCFVGKFQRHNMKIIHARKHRYINIDIIVCAQREQGIDIESLQNRLLKVCYVPATSSGLSRLFFLFLRWPLTVLMKQTRQAVRAFKQSTILRCIRSKSTASTRSSNMGWTSAEIQKLVR